MRRARLAVVEALPAVREADAVKIEPYEGSPPEVVEALRILEGLDPREVAAVAFILLCALPWDLRGGTVMILSKEFPNEFEVQFR